MGAPSLLLPGVRCYDDGPALTGILKTEYDDHWEKIKAEVAINEMARHYGAHYNDMASVFVHTNQVPVQARPVEPDHHRRTRAAPSTVHKPHKHGVAGHGIVPQHGQPHMGVHASPQKVLLPCLCNWAM